jgi:hypothetical protein
VGLVGDDHDVVPVGEHREASSSSPGMNFWMVANTMPPDGRLASLPRRSCRVFACTGCSRSRSWASENTPNSWPSRSLRSVMTTMVGFSIAASCITRAAKQVMVMLLPLPWVCHTTPPLPLWAATGARPHHLLDRRPHRVELVVAGDLLDQPAVVLEQHEVAQVVEQHGRGEHAADQGLQLVELAQRVEVDAIDGAPLHEALGIGRQRAHARPSRRRSPAPRCTGTGPASAPCRSGAARRPSRCRRSRRPGSSAR